MSDIIDPLIPPHRFERVQNQLYRGGYPKPRNFRFLRRQKLKTILSLVPGDQDTHLSDFCRESHIERITIPVKSPNENVTVTDPIVSQCLELMTDPAKLPLYVHCLDGSNVTGVVLMCLRKLQLWRVASYQNEYLRFEQDGEIIPEESEFVDAYKGAGLVLPNPYATWLWPRKQQQVVINDLPFKGGVHPVMPLVKLKQRISTDICQAEPLASLSRSATVPSLRDALECEDVSVFNAASLNEPNTDDSAAVHDSNGAHLSTRKTLSDTQCAGTALPQSSKSLMHTFANGRRHSSVLSEEPFDDSAPLALAASTIASLASESASTATAAHSNAIIVESTAVTKPGMQSGIASESIRQTQRADSSTGSSSLHASQSTSALSEAVVVGASASKQSTSGERKQRQQMAELREVLGPVLESLADPNYGHTARESSGNPGGAIRELELSTLVDALAIEGLGM
ncbi:protein-tyrosine-phosphatase [Coemansia sp. Benny D115]|nr:protein-tyrosine-phosphatase [Coemansia sp. Benny D115]